eukprot:7646829-Pyramimonas_sp.AAC.1
MCIRDSSKRSCVASRSLSERRPKLSAATCGSKEFWRGDGLGPRPGPRRGSARAIPAAAAVPGLQLRGGLL